MAYVGGDIVEVTFNHPTLGSGVINPKSDESAKYDLGGFRSADDAKGVDGAGNMIDSLTRTRWSFEVPVSWSMDNQQELEAVVSMAASPELADWTFTHVNGTIYGGKGKPVGDISGDAKASTFTLKVSGGGILKSI